MINYLIKKYYQIKLKNKLINNTKQSETNEQDYVLTTNNNYKQKHIIQHNIPIRSQGSINSCMSHAAIRAIEIQMKEFIEGSELYHYYMARKYVNNTFPADKGMTVIDGLKTIQKYGLCPEKLWIYNTNNINKTPDGFAVSFTELLKKLYNIEGYYRLLTINDIKTSLNNNLPVVFGLNIDTNYMSCKGNWIPGGLKNGGHAQLIYGYDEQFFYIENSWGQQWGNNGKYIAKISDIMKHGFDFSVIKTK